MTSNPAHNLIDRVCVGDIPTRMADLYPDRTAIVDGARTLSYRELDAQANRLGQALLNLGLKPQEVVGVMARNCIELMLTYFACAKAGLVCAGVSVLMKAFEVREAARLIEQHRVNMFVFLPMMYGELLADEEARSRDFSSVRKALYAMAPMPEERLKAIHELLPNADVILGSGQTEFTPATCLIRPEHQWSKAGSWGTATPMTRIAIMDDDGNLLPRGEVGEIVYRGPQLMNGYLNQPEQTQESFKHGWFHSGDIAWMDEDGAVWFTDRKKDMIKTGGENVASIEVERCLMEHPAVAEAAVIGLPHPRWGEAVTAAVVLKPGASADEAVLMEHCRQMLGGFKVPKSILVQTEFPRTGTGKIQKHIIRKQLQDLFENESVTSK